MPCWAMKSKHPHSDATYRIVQNQDMTYGVEVTIPGTQPTTVSSFASEAEADRWIASHKEGVAVGDSLRRRSFRFVKRT
jgi:hypothetical protein